MQSIRINVIKLSTEFDCMEITDYLANNFWFPEICSRKWKEEGEKKFILKKDKKAVILSQGMDRQNQELRVKFNERQS